MSGTSKLAAEKNQRILLELANQSGNDVCADCKARAPRWSSHSLGIFICVNCASIHRKIGTHITKVKSVTLDTWTKEQVEHMKQMGNVRSNSIYNPDETRYPPPTNMIDSERDSELEKYIRSKYEFKLFRQRDTSATEVKVKPKVSSLSPSNSIDRSAVVAALLGPSQSAASRTSTISTLRPRNVSVSSGTASSTAVPPRTAPPVSSSLSSPDKLNPPASAPAFPSRLQDRSVSQPVSSSVSAGAQGQSTFGGSLTSSQSHTIDATLPLQVLTPTSAPLAIPSRTSYLSAPNPFHNLQANSAPPFQSTFGQTNGVSPSSISSGLSISPSYSGTNLSPFQSSSIGTTPLSTTPSPNSFSPQVLPNVTGANSFSVQNTMTGFAQQPQAPFSQPAQSPFGQPQTPFNQSSQTPYGQHSQSPFGQAALTGQQFGQQQIQAQPFAQQPQMQFAQPPQLQAQTPGNPYLQTPSPFTGAQQLSGSPSPFAQTQPLPQMNTMQQAQQQTGFGGTNPFTSWIQQPPAQQQGGYNQQWGM